MKPEDRLVEQLQKVRDFLDDDICNLECNSRVREMDEDTWGWAMYHRDMLDKALAEYKASREAKSE